MNKSKAMGMSKHDPEGTQSIGQFNYTASTFTATHNTSHLKGKLLALEEMVVQIQKEMDFLNKEAELLRQEKETMLNVQKIRSQEINKSLTSDLTKVEDDLRNYFAHQRAENSRLQQQITTLKTEKGSLQQQLIALMRRMSELELQIGQEDS